MDHAHQQRDALHHRRALELRASTETVTLFDKLDNPFTTIVTTIAAGDPNAKTTTAVTTPTLPVVSAKTTSTTPLVLTPATSTATSSTISTTSTTTSSSTVSTTSTTSTTSSTQTTTSTTSHSTPSVLTAPLVTSTSTTFRTTSHASSSTNGALQATASSTNNATSGPSSGTIIGIAAGALAGLAIIALGVVFMIRRAKKKREEELGFDAANFRRSALLLDDEPNTGRGPRPPTMIERHVANAPAPPSAAYPYDQPSYGSGGYVAPGQYGAQSAYGASTQFGAPFSPPFAQYNPQDQRGQYGAPETGYGAAGVGSYGQHGAAYGTYPQQGQYGQPAPQEYGLARAPTIARPYAGDINPAPTSYANAGSNHYQDDHPISNPFANPLPRASSNGSSHHSHSPPTRDESLPLVSEKESNASGTILRRQNTQAGGAPPAYNDETGYADMQRDVKIKPFAVTNAGEEAGRSSGSASEPVAAAPQRRPAPPSEVATASADTRRPTSSYTLYDPEDVYGGI